MSDETEKHCMCGCIYLETDCPNCNKVTDAMRIEELEAKLAKAMRLMGLSVELGRWDLNPSLRDEMIDFIAELKGDEP